jgi:hypothetical protein
MNNPAHEWVTVRAEEWDHRGNPIYVARISIYGRTFVARAAGWLDAVNEVKSLVRRFCTTGGFSQDGQPAK